MSPWHDQSKADASTGPGILEGLQPSSKLELSVAAAAEVHYGPGQRFESQWCTWP